MISDISSLFRFLKMKISGAFVLPLVALFSCTSDQIDQNTWRTYKGDAGSSSYSSLRQIDRENINELQVAWTFRPNDAPQGSRYGKYECNPIVIDTVLYTTSPRHWVYAVDARNGQKLWSFDPFDGERGGGVSRGVTYWEEGTDRRILFTASHYLYALNAARGTVISEFGNEGKVNLNEGLGVDPDSVWVIPTSPGIVYGNLLILGSEVSELYDAAPGHIRAYNIRNGALEWTFHTIPRPGEAGYDTWPEEAWKYAGGANNWGGMSLDQRRGIVFVPLGSPTYDFYGANRKGKNLYGNCLVALDAATGKLIWHFQTVHHDLWDYDLPAPPNLVTVEQDGKKIDAVALTSKVGFLYLLNRVTGESLFPIEERQVPASSIPGEEAWPTQPFPLKPDPYVRQSMTTQEINDASPAFRDSVMTHYNRLRYEGLFTPPDPKGTLMLPGTRGGSEWGGAAYDPVTGMLYLNANESPEISTVQKVRRHNNLDNLTVYDQGRIFYNRYCASCHGPNREGQEPINPGLLGIKNRMSKNDVLKKIEIGGGRMPSFSSILKGNDKAILAYLFDIQNKALAATQGEEDTTTHYLNITAYSNFTGPGGQSSIKPPWGTLNAVDLSRGAYAWRIPLGNYPELQQKGAPETGMENWGGPMVTAGGLVFIGATRDNKFRAFDKISGRLLWETVLPGPGYATPSTYQCEGKQYVVISITGSQQEPGGLLVAFGLSEKKSE
jgi:quinoprotein glucose dehydrogenase